jgi:endonuclease/exonuclease/phosphatase family metal-dependent hydrolase
VSWFSDFDRSYKWRIIAAVVVCNVFATSSALFADTGTFIDRKESTDVRVMSYNILWDTIFPSVSVSQSEKFARVIHALDPDILNLQEIDFFGDDVTYTATDVKNLMNTIQPLPGGSSWFTYKGSDNVIVSKYPLSLTRSDTSPTTGRSLAMALVNLPDSRFGTDFYFMNNHFKCCGSPGGPEDVQRQQQADALVSWMRNARTAGGLITLPTNTPMAVVGDFNLVGLPDPLQTLLTGNISNEAAYGSDSPPDWDGTGLADLHPYHNITGADDYTWREDGSGFNPGRLDYILYTDSVLEVANKFILNTVAMSPTQLAATGLHQDDILKYSAGWYDHLPLVVDFRLDLRAPGDYNFDTVVDTLDFSTWKSAYNSQNLAADGNHDGRVDALDYTVWRNNLTPTPPGSGAFAPIPEPTSRFLFVLSVVISATIRRNRFCA